MFRVGSAPLAMIAIACNFIALSAAGAAEVTMRLKDGAFSFSGTLLRFDGTSYEINSPDLGVVLVWAKSFDCVGTGCINTKEPAPPVRSTATEPTLAPPASPLKTTVEPETSPPAALGVETIAVEGVPALGGTLLPALVRGWAKTNGHSVVQEFSAGSSTTWLRILDRAGNLQARLSIRSGNAASAIVALRTGDAQIAMSDRPITDSEAALLASIAPNMRAPAREIVLGLDALAVIVSPRNPISTLSLDNLSRIYGGQTTSWETVGGPSVPITVHSVDPAAVFEKFDSLVLRPGGRPVASAVRVQPSYEAIVDAVTEDATAIGIAPFSLVADAKAVRILSRCGLVTEPSVFAARAEEYPFTRRFYLYTARAELGPIASGLMQYAVSASAQETVAQHQLISQATEQAGLDLQAGRFAYATSLPDARYDAVLTRRLLADIGKGARFTTTIRFRTGTSVLDVKSQQDLPLLAIELARPELRARRLLLLGFSDGVGSAQQNSTLSQRRADQVRAALLALPGTPLDAHRVIAKGYGAVAPVACDDNTEGQQLNRRVEAWLVD